MDNIRLNRLRLLNYRNYESIECLFHEKINVITGLNGAGKTSILDAIYYLSNGKSYFTHLDSYIYRKTTDFFNINGFFQISEDNYELTIKSSRQKGKQITVDDKLIKTISDHVGRFPAFMIAPKDILILIESSAERRRLIDKTISQVDKSYRNHLIDYNRNLKQRNAALKAFQKNRNVDQLILDAFDGNMEAPANYIYEKRKLYLEEIGPVIAKYYTLLSEDKEEISISYKSKLNEIGFAELVKDSRQKDVLIAKSHEGIHRDDLSIQLNGMDIRKIGSQGQLKSAIISMKLAQLEWVKENTGIAALILLDDIFDKLDPNRVEKLIDICAKKLDAQVFITDTEKDRVCDSLKRLSLEYAHLCIENASIVNE